MGDGYQIIWLGWDHSGNSDKIWGYLCMVDGRFFAFWGRRGKTLQFKNHGVDGGISLIRLRTTKEKKGYNFVDPIDYNRLVQDFLEELELNCMTAILSDKI